MVERRRAFQRNVKAMTLRWESKNEAYLGNIDKYKCGADVEVKMVHVRLRSLKCTWKTTTNEWCVLVHEIIRPLKKTFKI